MDLYDYELVKNYDYSTYCNHLLEKYGAVGGDYFKSTFSQNRTIKRADEGLYIHHIDENKVANLSNYEVAKVNSFDYQKADRLVYADLFEHILLHILIGEQNNGLGFGGAEIMFAQANDKIWEDADVLDILKERCRNSINAYETLLTHNQTVFYELDNTLMSNDRALVVIGTGLGKTTTALAYIRKYGMRALVLGPSNTITQAWDKEGDGVKVNRGKRVRCIETGQEFYSASEAARFYNLSGDTVSAACRGDIQTACGYHWEYVKEDT